MVSRPGDGAANGYLYGGGSFGSCRSLLKPFIDGRVAFAFRQK